MEIFNLVLDLVLIGAAVWTIIIVRGSSGIIGRAFHLMMWGMILLGIAHISETITFEALKWRVDVVEFAHRLIVLGGIAFLIFGFSHIKKIQGEKLKILEQAKRQLEKKVKERTAELELAKNKSETLLASIGDAVFGIDRERNIIYFNPQAEELSGYTASEVLGKPYYDFLKFIKEKDKSENVAFIRTALEGQTGGIANATLLIRKDKREIPIDDVASPIKDDKGKILGAIVVFRDASEKRKIEHMKSEFSSLVAHQLRTPLGIIRNYGELLAGKDKKLTKDQQEYLGGIMNAAKGLLGLIDDLLNLSRLEEGQIKMEAVVVDPGDLIEETIRDTKQLFERKDQKFVFKKPASFPKLKIDPKFVREPIKNLLSNASKYTPKKGKIELEVFQIHSELIFRITDSGVGIPEEEQSKVFERFFRASNAKATEKGTGLGLYITKLMIELSGGRIWFESKENKGTTFFFALPVMVSKRNGE